MRARLLLTVLPALALVVAYVLGPEQAARLFRADLSALVVSVTLGAFAWDRRRDAWHVAVAGALVAISHLAVGGSVQGAGVLLALFLGCVAAAIGLTRLAEALQAPDALAPVVAWTVLAIGMSGLFWADHFAAQLPEAERYGFRQAALQLDPATACAYGASGYDRLHDANVYASVPLASSTHVPPTGFPTAALWLAIGLVSGLLSLGVRTPASE